VELLGRHRYPEVVGLGMDDLTPQGTEDPGRFVDAYRLGVAIYTGRRFRAEYLALEELLE
jgi:hypothetical protein